MRMKFFKIQPNVQILKVTVALQYTVLYIEYQSVCPFVGVGSHHPLPRMRVCLTRKQHSLGVRDSIRTIGQKAWHSIYTVLCGIDGFIREKKYTFCFTTKNGNTLNTVKDHIEIKKSKEHRSPRAVRANTQRVPS